MSQVKMLPKALSQKIYQTKRVPTPVASEDNLPQKHTKRQDFLILHTHDTIVNVGRTLKEDNRGKETPVPLETPRIREPTNAYTSAMCQWSTF